MYPTVLKKSLYCAFDKIRYNTIEVKVNAKVKGKAKAKAGRGKAKAKAKSRPETWHERQMREYRRQGVSQPGGQYHGAREIN